MTVSSDTRSGPRRLGAAYGVLSASRLLGPAMDRAPALAAAVAGAPVATLTVLAEVASVVGASGDDARRGRMATLPDATRERVLAGPVLVADVERDEGRHALPGVGSADRAYASVPVHDADGVPVGVLALHDRRPRDWTAREVELLGVVAASALVETCALRADARRGALLAAFDAAPVAVAVVRGADRVVDFVNAAFGELVPAARSAHVVVDDLGLDELAAGVTHVLDTGRAADEGDQRVTGGAGGGDERVARLTFAPVHPAPSEGHETPDVLVVGVDVSGADRDRRTIQRDADEQRLLARATAAMQTAVEPAAELAALARSLVPQFADACSAILLDGPLRPPEHTGAELTGRRVAFVVADDVTASTPELGGGVSWGTSELMAEALRTGRPALADVAGDTLETLRRSGAARWVEETGVRAIAVVPVRTHGPVRGLLVFASRPHRAPFTRADLAVMERIGVRAGAALDQGLAYQRQRDTSLALQRSMLTDAPRVAGLEVATRYRPTAADTEVGGDWYDAFALPGGDLVVAIGDVAGHDLTAAATMGQMRSMLRALAYDRDTSPAELISRLDAVATGLHVTDFTSAVVGRLRPLGGGHSELRWSNAGHPPPVLVDAAGNARELDGGRGMVLGVAPDRSRTTATVVLPPSSTLLLYTDGLVERRGPGPDAIATTLVTEAITRTEGALESLCDELLAAAPIADDVALLALRTAAREAHR